MNYYKYIFLLLSCSLVASAAEKVSDFEKSMKDSVLHYRNGKVTEALEALTKAQGILENEQTKQVGNVLPDAPESWKAKDATTEDVPAYLGGGKVVKKLYTATKGQEEILMEIYFGSSMIKLLRGMYANDQIAKSQGYKVKTAGGERVLVKELASKDTEISMPLDDEIMIKLTGKDGAKEDLMIKLMRDIDRKSLKNLIK